MRTLEPRNSSFGRIFSKNPVWHTANNHHDSNAQVQWSIGRRREETLRLSNLQNDRETWGAGYDWALIEFCNVYQFEYRQKSKSLDQPRHCLYLQSGRLNLNYQVWFYIFYISTFTLISNFLCEPKIEEWKTRT